MPRRAVASMVSWSNSLHNRGGQNSSGPIGTPKVVPHLPDNVFIHIVNVEGSCRAHEHPL
jgi:hypothetical protein